MDKNIQNTGDKLQACIKGSILAFPIVIGYITIGFAYGVLARKAGISVGNTMLMSLLVFAGSAQLIAVGLIMTGISSASIIATTFIVNLRHFLMSAALTPYLKKWRKRELAALAYQLTDETFVIHATQFSAGRIDKTISFTINATAQTSWFVGTCVGVAASRLIADMKPYALDYALPAMFIGLLVIQINDRIKVWVALLTGILAVVLLRSGIDQWSVIIATLVGATFGIGVEKWIKR